MAGGSGGYCRFGGCSGVRSRQLAACAAGKGGSGRIGDWEVWVSVVGSVGRPEIALDLTVRRIRSGAGWLGAGGNVLVGLNGLCGKGLC
jgi:hypothetical protein